LGFERRLIRFQPLIYVCTVRSRIGSAEKPPTAKTTVFKLIDNPCPAARETKNYFLYLARHQRPSRKTSRISQPTRMANKAPYQTTFEPEHTIQPIYTGGGVALDQNGRILATTLGEDALLTDLNTGRQLAKIEGVHPLGHDSLSLNVC